LIPASDSSDGGNNADLQEFDPHIGWVH